MDFLCLLDDIATTIDSLDIVFGKLKRRPFFRTSPNKMKKLRLRRSFRFPVRSTNF